MAIFGWAKKKAPVQTSQIETKSLTGSSFAGFLQDTDNWDLSFAVLIQYFKRCAPFSDAVGTIADAFADISPVVKNKKTDEYIYDHPVLSLLEFPNNDMSGEDFRRHIASMYLITGNPFLKSIGDVKRPPLNIDVLNPTYANIEASRTGDIGRIRVNSEFESAVYLPESEQRRYRYRHGDMELWPCWGFNPDRGSRNFFGTPIAKPLYYDIEQYISSGQHNKSLLQRGARPGGTFSTEGTVPLTDAQFKRMQEQIDMYYVGANNAGRPLLLENTKYQEHIVTNRDMDYKTMSENARNAIYRAFKIPLPTVDSGTMTFSNFSSAALVLYDKAILPLTKFLFRQFTIALMYRFEKDWQNFEITYDPTSIPALEMRRMEIIKTKKQVAVHTVNELRRDFGDEPLPGGDVLLRPAAEIPALEDTTPPMTDKQKDKEETEKALRSAFGADGAPRFTEEQIDKLMGR